MSKSFLRLRRLYRKSIINTWVGESWIQSVPVITFSSTCIFSSNIVALEYTHVLLNKLHKVVIVL